MSDVLLQYGAIGVISLMCLMAVRVLFNKLAEALKREQERADRLESELLKLNETVRNEYVGTISDATRAILDARAAVRKT